MEKDKLDWSLPSTKLAELLYEEHPNYAYKVWYGFKDLFDPGQYASDWYVCLYSAVEEVKKKPAKNRTRSLVLVVAYRELIRFYSRGLTYSGLLQNPEMLDLEIEREADKARRSADDKIQKKWEARTRLRAKLRNSLQESWEARAEEFFHAPVYP